MLFDGRANNQVRRWRREATEVGSRAARAGLGSDWARKAAFQLEVEADLCLDTEPACARPERRRVAAAEPEQQLYCLSRLWVAVLSAFSLWTLAVAAGCHMYIWLSSARTSSA